MWILDIQARSLRLKLRGFLGILSPLIYRDIIAFVTDVECKPFKKSHEQQLQLVTSFNWIDLDKLHTVDEIVREAFKDAEDYTMGFNLWIQKYTLF